MNPRPKYGVVLVTAPDRATARKIAKVALRSRLAACVNLIPAIESHYWWQGRIESSREVLLVLKTTAARLKALEKRVIEAHPYDTPEFITLGIRGGNRRYLDWLDASVRELRGA